MKQTANQVRLGVSYGVAAGAFWGFVFLAPQVLNGFQPSQLAVARYLVYGLFSLVLLLPRVKSLPRLPRDSWFALVGLSLCGNVVYYVLLGRAVQYAGGASTSLIIGLLPVAVTLWGSREHGALPIGSLLPPLLLCCLGVGLIGFHALHNAGTGPASHHRAIGLLCAFGSLACWTTFAVANSRYLRHHEHISAHDWSLLTGVVTGSIALVLGGFVLVQHADAHTPRDWVRFWAVSAGVAFFASILGNGFWNQASRLLPLTLSGQMIVFETLFALLYTFLWEHRFPTLLEVFAIASLLVGVLWCASLHRVSPVERVELAPDIA